MADHQPKDTSLENASQHHKHEDHHHSVLGDLHNDPEATVTTASQIEELSGHKIEEQESTAPVQTVVFPNTKKLGYWQSRFMIRPPFNGDPRVELSRVQKGIILAIISQAGCLGGFSSTIYFPSLVQITKDLNASQTTINASVSLFILFMGVSPLLTSTISDRFKIRRVLYIAFITIFALASLGGGFAKNAPSLIVARVFQAVGSSGASVLGAGSVADIYVPTEQGTAMGLMFLGQFLGPVLGPPIGGLLAEAFGWTSTFFFMTAVSCVVILELFFLLPETYRQEPEAIAEEQRMAAEAAAALKEGGNSAIVAKPPKKRYNPFQAVLLLRHPVVLLSSIETGLIFALMFSIETITPVLYTDFYGLTEAQVGYTYLSAGFGSIFGSMIGGRLSDRSLKKSKEKRANGEALLEDRLSTNMWIAAFAIVPLGSLLFGWGAEKHLNIAAPIVGFGIYNFGMAQVMSASAAYMVNMIPGQGSSTMAAGNLLRMIMACIFSLVAQIIVDHVGYGYYGVIQAALNIFCTGLFFIVKLRGPGMRARAAKQEALSK